jgi:hypothetical protein
MSLAQECQERLKVEQAAAERSEQFEYWCQDAQRAVRQAGGRSGYVDDHYSWFESKFDAEMTPEAAAELGLQAKLDEDEERLS